MTDTTIVTDTTTVVVAPGTTMVVPHIKAAWVVLELALQGYVVGFAGWNKEEARLGHT